MDKLIERMKEVMQTKNIKAAELSRRSGIDRSSLSHYLSGDYLPKMENIEKIAAALGVSVSYLAGYSDEANPTGDPALDDFLDKFTRMTQPGSFGAVSISEEELELVLAFRKSDPSLQAAVRRVLGLPVGDQK